MLSKKYYIMIAEIFKNNFKILKEQQKEAELGLRSEMPSAMGVSNALIRDFSEALANDNPRFSQEKFHDYINK